jgi:hypothetical protein
MDPDPSLDPTPIISDFNDAKKLNLSMFFSCNLPTGTLSSVLKIKFLAKTLCLNPILQALLQKRERSGSAPLTIGSGFRILEAQKNADPHPPTLNSSRVENLRVNLSVPP